MLVRNVLIIDDSSNIHEDFKRVLTPSQNKSAKSLDELEEKVLGESFTPKNTAPEYKLSFASSGPEAVKKLKEAKEQNIDFQLVFLDIRMPGGMDGVETLSKLWDIDSRLEIVLCTAYSDYDFSKIFSSFGLTDQILILKKPFDSIEVQQMALSQTTKWFLSRYNEEKVEILEEEVSENEKELGIQRMKSLKAAKMASLGEMAAGVAHEINNPLTIIHGNADHIIELIENGSKASLDRAVYSAQKIQATSLRISKVVKSLRNFARDGSMDPFESWEVFRIIEDTKELCNQRFYEKGVDFNIAEVPKDLRIECRPVEISQVLLNLFNNAFDAVLEFDKKKISLEFKDLGDEIEFRVIDSGSGIPINIQEKILQPFFTTKEVGKGTGLGLSISHGIIQSHGGELFIDNSCDNTCFVIRLKKEVPEAVKVNQSSGNH